MGRKFSDRIVRPFQGGNPTLVQPLSSEERSAKRAKAKAARKARKASR